MGSLKILLVVVLAGAVIAVHFPGAALAADYEIRVDFSKARMGVFDSARNEIMIFPVALPKFKLKNLPISGRVVGIQRRPAWYPTPATRAYYYEKHGVSLPRVIRPGDPRNAMGEAKILIAFDANGVNPLVRIHGTNDEFSIGKRVSRGCIRLYNKDILALVGQIFGKPTEIIFFSGSS